MLQPKRTKFRKAHKGRIHGQATSGATLAFGQFGLKAVEPERVTARQIEAARRALTRHMKRAGRVWIRVFPDVPVSKKPAEVRMGSGKGTPELWVARGVMAMAELKIEDIRRMSDDEMDAEVLKLKKERFNLRFQRATGQLENTARIREARRDIARVKTIARQKRAAQNKAK